MKEIDWDRVFDLIVHSRISDWDQETIAAAVSKAASVWVGKDMSDGGKVIATELYGEEPVPYKIDLILEHGGKLAVVDWKAKRSGKLDDRWVLRETRSWQPRIYAAAVATKYGKTAGENYISTIFPLVYEVRGVTLEEKPSVATVKLVLSRRDAVEAVRYLRGITAMRDALIERGKCPWVKDPSGCRMFGEFYKCEHEDICWGQEAPPVQDDEKVKRAFSHSAAQEFLRCPERYRLGRLIGKDEDEENVASGKAFHAAMEEIYSQLLSGETHQNEDASK